MKRHLTFTMIMLRRTLLAVCGTCFLVLAMAQDTIGFDDTTGVWYVADTYPQGNAQNPNFIRTNTLRYFYSGDTVIAGDAWGRMYSIPTADQLPEPEFQGFARRSNDLVLFLDSAGVVDTLYDFGLQVGDSMHYVSPFYDTYLMVEAMDSVPIQGVQHRVYRFSNYFLTLEDELTDTWIEGIGSIHGPLAPRMPSTLGYNYAFPDSTRLTCYSLGDVTLWEHGGYPGCVVNIALGLEEVFEGRSDHLSVWPSPGSDNLNVSVDGAGAYAVSVQDLQGRTVLERVIGSGTVPIDVSSLSKGMYTVLFIGAGGVRSTTKWIKQ